MGGKFADSQPLYGRVLQGKGCLLFYTPCDGDSAHCYRVQQRLKVVENLACFIT